jgi:hypothetical protein
MIVGLAGDLLGSSYAASEDAIDVMVLSLEGHLFKSTRAPHYDLAPMHTFLYIIISQVLELRARLDVRAFSYPEAFDAVIAVESVHGILGAELLRRLEGLAKQGGLIVLALPALSRSVVASVLVQQGYAVYRYFLRGFILVRVDKAEVPHDAQSPVEGSRVPDQDFPSTA